MSAPVQPINQADSIARLRQRMIREVEIFLEGSIGRAGEQGRRMIPTRTRHASGSPSGWASWYHLRVHRGAAAAAAATTAGETGSC